MNTLLHTHEAENGGILEKLLKDVFLDGLLDALKIIPFLFVTYLVMELIEHKASAKTRTLLIKSGKFGPLACGLIGTVPQCGFSAAASNFYAGRIITLGMLVSVFLSTSDEMLPIMISGKVPAKAIFAILGYKVFASILVGYSIDLVLRFMKKKREEINVHQMCEDENCHCEHGVFHSALHHTVAIGAFVLIVTLLINVLIVFLGADRLSEIMYDKPVLSHFIAAVIGLVPNCATSVLLTDFCVEGFITVGTMLSGLFSGAGVGLLVLFKVNKRPRENLSIMAILVCTGVVFGFIADLLNFSLLFE